MLKYLLIFSLSFSAFSKTLEVVNNSYKFEDKPEFKAILEGLKPYGTLPTKNAVVEPSKTNPAVKTLSKGEQAVEEAKARNRAILAEMNKEKKVENKEELSDLEKWKKEERETLANWKKESASLLASWKKEQEAFLGRIEVYKENTFAIPAPKVTIVEKKISVETLPTYFVINKALDIPIRDQWNRPTCSAFAGARAVEILLAQNDQKLRLSPQYLYWASKPKCHTSPCSQKGSWITPALEFSKQKNKVDIPKDETCGYAGISVPNNETQIPLKTSCDQGEVKIMNYEEVRSLAETVEKIKGNTPVIMASKLSPNFYKNKGLVTLADSTKMTDVKLDSHAMGHAYLGVGVIELPEKLRATEGNYCIIIANSWGEGFGAGGYTCLTENWLMKYRQPSPFIAVTKVMVK